VQDLSILIPSQRAGNASIYEVSQEKVEAFSVEAVTIDEYFHGQTFKKLLVKIDVEGAEFDVFLGMKNLLKRHPGAVVIFEWSPNQLKKSRGTINDFSNLIFSFADTVTVIENGKVINGEDMSSLGYCNLLLKTT
jgi:hypothetical protein